jgi:activating signal cointegrator 1
MKCLTICQPYAELILRGEKRVENRRWPTAHRGPLLIHAGKSREYLELDWYGLQDETYDIPLAEMDFGAIVGVCQVLGCVQVTPGLDAETRAALETWPWLATHEHTEGPWCWVLERAYRFSRPIPYRGQQGLFEVPAGVAALGLSEAMAVYRDIHFSQHPA